MLGHRIKIDIFKQPAEDRVKRLLNESQLDSSDFTSEHVKHFFGFWVNEEIEGVVGIDLLISVALLRSLAVASLRRIAGLGSRLVAHAEDHVSTDSVRSRYLFTNTAESFFEHRGYLEMTTEN